MGCGISLRKFISKKTSMFCGKCNNPAHRTKNKKREDKNKNNYKKRKRLRKLRRKLKTNSSEFYLSIEWRRLRYIVIKERGKRCECCGILPPDNKSVHVDHIKPRSRYPELELDFNNLQILCIDCNLGKGDGDEINWRIRNNLERQKDESAIS